MREGTIISKSLVVNTDDVIAPLQTSGTSTSATTVILDLLTVPTLLNVGRISPGTVYLTTSPTFTKDLKSATDDDVMLPFV